MQNYEHSRILRIAGFKENVSEPRILNLLNQPIKEYGRVEYVFRPRTTYPPRIYVFMHAELWLQRNRIVSGCSRISPFFSRPMNSEELIYHHFDTRLVAYQFENWSSFIEHEKFEFKIWNGEKESFGDKLLNELLAFQDIYKFRLEGEQITDGPIFR